jgi:hypothetical protein
MVRHAPVPRRVRDPVATVDPRAQALERGLAHDRRPQPAGLPADPTGWRALPSATRTTFAGAGHVPQLTHPAAWVASVLGAIGR